MGMTTPTPGRETGDREYATRALDSLSNGITIVDDAGTTVVANEAWRAFVDTTGIDPAVTRTAANYLRTLRRGDVSLDDVADPTTPLDLTLTLPYQESDDARSHRLRISPFAYDDEVFATLSVAEDARARLPTTPLKTGAIDAAPVGITISDYTRPDNPLIYANAAFERITGYDVLETLSRNCRFLQSEATDDAAVQRFRDAMAANESTTVELRNERKDGEEFWNAVTIAPLRDETGTVTNWVGFQQDVTARKRAEEALSTERDQYELLNQIIRHDIRNDMAVIRGWGEQLREDLDADQRETLARVMNAAVHTQELTEEVRDLTAILGSEDPALEPIDLGDVLTREIEQVRSTFEYQADSLIVDGPVDLPEDCTVSATPLLSSVFTNLLDNAVLHSDGGAVHIDVSVDADAETCTVRIADNGPGIPDAQKRAVFDHGEQGERSSGTGLGLYLVDELVTQFGGNVWIEDNDPRGAIVCVELQRVR